jgi:hypothetical protein
MLMRKKRENVQNPAPYEQMREVLAMVVKAVPQLTASQASHFIGRQRQVAAKIHAIFAQADSWWVVTERPGVNTSQLIAECRALFPVWCWQADEEFDKDFSAPHEATTREFKPNVEADEDLKNMSYDDLQRVGIQGITLRERLIMELQYFKETGTHLDAENITLCSGPLYRDGSVASTGWDPGYGRFDLHWDDRDSAHDDLRSRQAVTR